MAPAETQVAQNEELSKNQEAKEQETKELKEKMAYIREITVNELAKAVDFCNKFLSLPRNHREAFGLQFITSKVPVIIMQLLRTKDEAYHERNKLLAYLSQHNPSYLTEHDPEDANWDDMWRTILVVSMPEGETQWHIHDHEIKLFEHLKFQPHAKTTALREAEAKASKQDSHEPNESAGNVDVQTGESGEAS